VGGSRKRFTPGQTIGKIREEDILFSIRDTEEE
jgi:hypothetical protein